jgi:hypothetical protein
MEVAEALVAVMEIVVLIVMVLVAVMAVAEGAKVVPGLMGLAVPQTVHRVLFVLFGPEIHAHSQELV